MPNEIPGEVEQRIRHLERLLNEVLRVGQAQDAEIKRLQQQLSFFQASFGA